MILGKGNFYLPILAGRLKGEKWFLGAGGKILRLMFSTYEPEQTKLFEEIINPGKIVFDVGAHAGYYTLLSSILVGANGKVVSFEPNPNNYSYLNKNVLINNLSNVTTVESAVSNQKGFCYFETRTGSGTGHFSDEGTLKVKTKTLDDFVKEKQLIPDYIKIDVEGAELLVLEGASHTLVNNKPVVFLSTHGDEIHKACYYFLSKLNYRFEPILGTDVFATQELVCYPLLSRICHADSRKERDDNK